MKAVIALASLALLTGCNQLDDRVLEYNFKVSHVRNGVIYTYHCDDFLITHSFVTFIDHNGVKRAISGDIDIRFRRNDLTRN